MTDEQLDLGELGYEPGDFEPLFGYHREASDRAANLANALLAARIKAKGVKVYQRNSQPYTGHDFETGVWTAHKRASDTHEAYLILPRRLPEGGGT